MNNPLLLSTLSGFFFGVWPLVAANSKIPGALLTVLVSIGTTLTVYLGQTKAVSTNIGNITVSGGALLLALGVLNGIGIILYGKVLTMPTGNTSSYVAMTFVVMTLVTVMAGLFYGESLNLNKVIGAVLAIGAMWFLNKA